MKLKKKTGCDLRVRVSGSDSLWVRYSMHVNRKLYRYYMRYRDDSPQNQTRTNLQIDKSPHIMFGIKLIGGKYYKNYCEGEGNCQSKCFQISWKHSERCSFRPPE